MVNAVRRYVRAGRVVPAQGVNEYYLLVKNEKEHQRWLKSASISYTVFQRITFGWTAMPGGVFI